VTIRSRWPWAVRFAPPLFLCDLLPFAVFPNAQWFDCVGRSLDRLEGI